MSPRKRASSFSLAWRFIVIFCTVQIIWSKAQTSPRTDVQITPNTMTKSTAISGTNTVTKDDLLSTKASGLPGTTEVDPEGKQMAIPDFKTTEKTSLTGVHSTQAGRSKTNIQTNLQSLNAVTKVRFSADSYSLEPVTEYPTKAVINVNTSERPFTEDPAEAHRGAVTSDSFQCSPTQFGGTNDIDIQPKCNNSDLNPDVSRELVSLRTPINDILTENTQVFGSETATAAQSFNYLSRLPNLCPYTKICEKSTKDTACCGACSCEDDCGDNCCFRNGTTAKFTGSRQECLHVQRELPGKQVSNYRTYKIVRTCRIPEMALYIRFMEPTQQEDSWKYKLSPVFSNRTNITYYNMKYAECNDEFDANVVHWDRIEYCASVPGQTYEDLHNAIHEGSCDTLYKPPEQYRDLIQECYKIDVDACNIAGEWDYYDEQIERGCKDLRFPYIRKDVFDMRREPTVFANIFCYLCNNKRDIFVPQTCDEGHAFDQIFTSILSYTDNDPIRPVSATRRSPARNNSACSNYQILDINTDSCENILCPIGSYRDTNGHCVHFVKIMNKLAMQVVFQLRSVDNGKLVGPLNETEVDDLLDVLKIKMNHSGIEWCYGCQLIQFIDDIRAAPVNTLYTVNIQLNEIKTDYFYELMRNLSQVPVELNENGKKSFVRFALYHSSLDEHMSPVFKFQDNVAKMPTSNTIFKSKIRMLTRCVFTYEVHISKVTFCEHVILKRDGIIPENTEDGSRIFVKSIGKYLYDFIVDIDNNIRICVDDFIQLEASPEARDQTSPKDSKDKSENQINVTKGVSFVGLFVDASFLTSAVVALCLCKELPKAVKFQNMLLVFNLQLIQISLLISIILSVSGTACSIVGLCVHFLSLSVQFIASMSFKVSSISSSFTIPVLQWRNIILSFLKPHILAFASVSMSTSFSVYYSKIGELGHGSWKTICFITDNFHRIISFLIPLGLAAAVAVYSVITDVYRKGRRHNQAISDIPESLEYKPMHLCFCLLNLIIWLSEYFGYDTEISLVIFIVLNSIQCIFLSVCLVVLCRRVSRNFIANEMSMM